MAITPPPQMTSPAPRRRRWRWLAWLTGTFSVVLIAGTIFAIVRVQGYITLAKTLPDEIAGAKREGLALTPADLRRDPPVPAQDNAAPIYRQIDALYKQRPEKDRLQEGDKISAFLKPTRTQTDRENARAILLRDADLIQLGEKAAARPDCDFDRPWQQGADVLFPEYSTMRHLDRLLAARAILEKEAGNPQAALRDVATGARISVHCGQDPALIAHLVRLATEAIMNRPFVEVLQQYGDRPDILRQAAETEESFGAPPDVLHGMRGELVTERAMVDQIRRPPASAPNWMKGLPLPKSSPAQRAIFADAWESRMVAFWRKADQGMSGAGGDLLKQEQALIQVDRDNRAHQFEAGYELNAILMPVFAEAPRKTMQMAAMRRLRIGMLDLLQYRAAHGSFPEALTALPDASLLTDPFTDTPLIYKKRGSGFILYSVSRNRKDDGGDETLEKDDSQNSQSSYPRDIVVRYSK